MKKVKGIILSLIVSIAAICMMPFSVSAELDEYNFSIDDVFTRANISYDSIDSTFRNYVTINFKGHYYGQANFYYTYKLGSSSTTTSGNRILSFNGDSVTFMISTSGQSINQTSFTITNITNPTNVVRVDNYTEQFPWESFPIQSFNLANNQVVGIDYRFGYIFNVFRLIGDTSDDFTTRSIAHQFYVYQNIDYYFIFWIDKNFYADTSSDYFTFGNRAGVKDISVLNRFHYDGHTTSLVRVTLTGLQNGGNTITYIGHDDALYMPVYFNFAEYKAISTDFALQFGLTNELLDSLKAIQPTIDTDQAADDLDSSADNMQDDFDDMFTIENQYNQDLNNQIDNIDFSNPLSGNQSLLSSGNFVIQVFNGLIANNPISLLIIIACILMVARRLFG